MEKETKKKKSKKEVVEEVDEITSAVSSELARLELQVADILSSLESVKLLEIEDIEARMKATQLKVNIQLKLPELIGALEILRNKAKVNTEDIKGSKNLSPLEDGTLD